MLTGGFTGISRTVAEKGDVTNGFLCLEKKHHSLSMERIHLWLMTAWQSETLPLGVEG